jgi:hypothetical protein
MTEVNYFVALPFVVSDDGITAGEPTECLNPVAAVYVLPQLAYRTNGRWH